jgi:hypothetical protein
MAEEMNLTEGWYFKNNDSCYTTVVTNFLKNINEIGLKNVECHKIFDKYTLNFENIDDSVHDSVPLDVELKALCCPRVLSILSTDIDKDLDLDLDKDKIELIQEIRYKFLRYIMQVVQVQSLTRFEMTEFFVIIYMYRILFTTAQYGMALLFKAILRKLLELIKISGLLSLCLIFCEFCPYTIALEHYPICKQPDDIMSQLRFIKSHVVLNSLLEKHRNKLSLVFPLN